MLLGDVLVEFDGTQLNDTADVLALLNNSDRVLKTIKAQIVRGGALVELAIAVGERPNDVNG